MTEDEVRARMAGVVQTLVEGLDPDPRDTYQGAVVFVFSECEGQQRCLMGVTGVNETQHDALSLLVQVHTIAGNALADNSITDMMTYGGVQ